VKIVEPLQKKHHFLKETFHRTCPYCLKKFTTDIRNKYFCCWIHGQRMWQIENSKGGKLKGRERVIWEEYHGLR